jgi:hypothetical protein
MSRCGGVARASSATLRRMSRLLRGALSLGMVLCTAAHGAGAQLTVRSWLPWRTIETSRFVFHYPVELEEWTWSVASRMESIDSAVTRIVGYAPTRKTEIVVDDPYAVANGSAWPFLDAPIINFWATPPDPRDDIGEFRDWGEMLATHEFAHIAHLTRPSRNNFTRRVWEALPVDLGPISINAPRWVIEGYATYVEGRVTGAGRPHGSWRPAILRQWALEGALPTYDQMNAWGAFEGGSFAYLAGSAYLEWLARERGDSSLVHLWRRMTARRTRGFDEAFAGVFGERARTLYGRFTVDLTANAVAAERELRAAGIDSGVIVQRLAWGTGDPSISCDGKRVALVVRSATRPPRVIVWGTAIEPDTGRATRDSALLAADPEDVPARSIYPPPKRVLATLPPVGGSTYRDPRFLRDGRVLLWRNTARGDGSLSPDLYLWDIAHGSVRRITRGASVRQADPSPDGRFAVATQCRGGRCDLVRVALDDGRITTLARGGTQRSFYRPRLSPDGSTIAVAVHIAARWRIALFDIDGSGSRLVDPNDGADRYDVSFLSPRAMIAVSNLGGIPNLERLDPATGAATTLTRVTGAAVAPVLNPADSSIWFLSLYSKGYDLRRLPVATRAPRPVVVIGPRFFPAGQVPGADGAPIAEGPVSPPRAYGLGNRIFRWIPQPQFGADGVNGTLALTSQDVIGRSSVMGQIGVGEPATWRGGSVSGAWRGYMPELRFQLYGAAQRLRDHRDAALATPPLDVRLAGATFFVEHTHTFERAQNRLQLGVTTSRVTSSLRGAAAPNADTTRWRTFAYAELAAGWQQRVGSLRLSEALGGSLDAGTSFGADFRRGVGWLDLGIRGFPLPMVATGFAGSVSADANAFEHFVIGGESSTLVDHSQLSQRITMAALPLGTDAGTSLLAYRIALPVAALTPYLWGASTTHTGRRFETWHRVVGVEFTTAIGAVPLAGTPAARAEIGIGRSLDSPFVNSTRAYLTFLLTP